MCFSRPIFRKHNSTETTLLKVTDEIFARFADHQSTILVALDQSAAFDCIDHPMLIHRLNHSFGLTGIALRWISSYIEFRSTYVHWKQASPSFQLLEIGFGTPLFSLYIHCFSESFRVNHHQYADDTQTYLAASKNGIAVYIRSCTSPCATSLRSRLYATPRLNNLFPM
jgi:hypothetical protein